MKFTEFHNSHINLHTTRDTPWKRFIANFSMKWLQWNNGVSVVQKKDRVGSVTFVYSVKIHSTLIVLGGLSRTHERYSPQSGSGLWVNHLVGHVTFLLARHHLPTQWSVSWKQRGGTFSLVELGWRITNEQYRLDLVTKCICALSTPLSVRVRSNADEKVKSTRTWHCIFIV